MISLALNGSTQAHCCFVFYLFCSLYVHYVSIYYVLSAIRLLLTFLSHRGKAARHVDVTVDCDEVDQKNR